MFTDKPAPAPCACDRRHEAGAGGARRGDLPQPVGDQRVEAAAVADPRGGARRRAPPARRQRRAPGARGSSAAQQQAAAQAAGQEVLAAFEQQVRELAVKYGQTGIPRLDDPTFVSSVVFDSARPGQPKPRFSLFWPSADSAQILVRLRPDLSQSERSEAIDQIRAAVADPAFRIRDASYVVSGAPVVVDGLAEKLSSAIFVLLIAALVVMTLTLALVFRPPAAAAAAGRRAGRGGDHLRAAGGRRRLADDGLDRRAADPDRARGRLRDPVPGPLRRGAGRRLLPAARRGRGGRARRAGDRHRGGGDDGRVPASCCSRRSRWSAASASCSWSGSRSPSSSRSPPGWRCSRSPARASSPSAVTAGGLRRVREGARRRDAAGARPGGSAAGRWRSRSPRPAGCSRSALVLAVAGWIAGTRAEVISDLRELVPSDLPELQNVDELQETTGVSGEVEVAVRADDLTDPAVVAWMSDFKQRVLDRRGFGGRGTTCAQQDASCARSSTSPTSSATSRRPRATGSRGSSTCCPKYFLAAFVSRDADGLEGRDRGDPVRDQGDAVRRAEAADRRDPLRDRPAGNRERPAGRRHRRGRRAAGARRRRQLGALRRTATCSRSPASRRSRWRCWRSTAPPRRALVPLIPIVLATGWASLGLAIAGVPLNPMSATLGALVIAIATEFSVLLAARYEEERGRACRVGEALRRAYSRTGMAVLASGITAIAGFAALIATDIRMLRDFGLVTVLDLGVALIGVLLVLPAALVWAETGFARLGSLPAAPAGAHPAPDRGMSDEPRRARLAPAVEPLFDLRRARLPDRDRGRDREHAAHPRRRHPRDRARPIAATRCRSSRSRTCAATPEGDANVFQDDCETAANPCPADDQPRPRPARSTCRERDPRLRPLRPPAGDLVLVHAAAPTACPTQDVVDQVAQPLPRPGQLPLDQRPRRPRRGAADRRRARLDDPGRLGRRRRGLEPLPGRRLPDGRLRLSRAASSARRSSAATSSPSEQLTADVERLLRESRRRAAEDR